MSLSSRRTAMTLYSDPDSQYSHRVRLVLAEKGINVDVVDIYDNDIDEDLLELNPRGSTPTLHDRDTVIQRSTVIMEYLDERYPHPPLLPVFPVARAECRILIAELEEQWSQKVDELTLPGHRKTKRDKARIELRDNVVSLASNFRGQKFVLGDEFSLCDCCVLPVLWRLDKLDIKLPDRQTRELRKYMTRMFEVDSFLASLSEEEKEMRP